MAVRLARTTVTGSAQRLCQHLPPPPQGLGVLDRGYRGGPALGFLGGFLVEGTLAARLGRVDGWEARTPKGLYTLPCAGPKGSDVYSFSILTCRVKTSLGAQKVELGPIVAMVDGRRYSFCILKIC